MFTKINKEFLKLNDKKKNPIKKWAKDFNLIKEDIQMANKHMKRCSTSYVIRERQGKTAVRFHCTPIRMANIQNTDSTKCWVGLARMWSNRNSHSSLVGMQNGSATVEDSLQFLTKVNTLLPYDPAIVFLGIYPDVLGTYVHTKTCTQMFIATLLIMPKLGRNQDVAQ